MRVLHLSTSDIRGGAGRAAYRIHQALLSVGVDSRMIVKSMHGNDGRVRPAHRGLAGRVANLEGRVRTFISTTVLRPESSFSVEVWRGSGAGSWRCATTDIIHLHWVCDGFLGIKEIGRIQTPIVWTCHDQWPFTGGCHYSGGCERYLARCGECPLIRKWPRFDLTRHVLDMKKRHWKDLQMCVVAPSRWMARRAGKSSLFGHRKNFVIPNPVDLARFRPTDPVLARTSLGIDRDRPTLLFVAMGAIADRRKGFDLLAKTIESMKYLCESTQLIVIGASQPDQGAALDSRIRYLGSIHDDGELALAYSAADVFVAPSREDNFPNTVAESLACGTPVAAFRVGGLPEMVDHQETGYLAEPFDPEDLASGISALLRQDRIPTLAKKARESALTLFSPEMAARRYLDVYRGLVGT